MICGPLEYLLLRCARAQLCSRQLPECVRAALMLADPELLWLLATMSSLNLFLHQCCQLSFAVMWSAGSILCSSSTLNQLLQTICNLGDKLTKPLTCVPVIRDGRCQTVVSRNLSPGQTCGLLNSHFDLFWFLVLFF